MIKPPSLRAALLEANPHLRQSPESLHVFIEGGAVSASYGNSAAFRYAYTLVILIVDYAGHPDSLFAPLIAWLRIHQPDLLLNHDRNTLQFESELISDKTADVQIKLPLTESVVLREVDGQLIAEHLPEPPVDPAPGDWSWELYVKGIQIDWPPASADDMNIPAWMT